MNTREKDLLGILENSVDWYLVLKIQDKDAIIEYVNKVMRDSCPTHHLIDGQSLSICPEFSKLFGTVLQVAKTKERVNFPQYVIPYNDNVTKILDLQVYANNGNVVICGRDLEPVIYEFRANTALLNHKLEKLLAQGKKTGAS